jgi:hypothetical protein
VIALDPPIEQIIDLQDSEGLRINEECQVLDEVRSSLVGREINDDELFQSVLFQKGGRMLDNLTHPFFFFPILF